MILVDVFTYILGLTFQYLEKCDIQQPFGSVDDG